jgi:hypothetical protein
MPALPQTEGEIEPAWLTEALRRSETLERGRVRAIEHERIAIGVGLMGRLARLRVTYEDADARAPRTMIVKLPAEMAQNRDMARGLGFYERECNFYRYVAPRTPLRAPRAYYNEFHPESGDFVLLLQDLGAARTGDQIAGGSAEDTRLAVLQIARHHGRFWGKTADLPLIDAHSKPICTLVEQTFAASLAPTFDALADVFTKQRRTLCERTTSALTPIAEENYNRTLTICHGDFRSDNLFYGPDASDTGLSVVDWQIMCRATAVFDVAYHLSQSITPETRRAIEKDLLREYHRELLANGATDYPWETCLEHYRKSVLYCLCYPINVCGSLDLGNERGRALGRMLLERSLLAIEDCDAAELLPA